MPIEVLERELTAPRRRAISHESLLTSASAPALLSLVLLIPCFWHSRIQAGDLGSHVYNAWLAQLIQHGELPGLTIVSQWSNVLFDVLLLHLGTLFGWAAAEKILVSFAVLLFFWGAFWFLSTVAGKPPWALTPILFALTYGYVFHMGFMNYYLSVGFALLALSLAWRSGAVNWTIAVALSALSLVAHPIGFVLFWALAIYISMWRHVPEKWRWPLPVLAIVGLAALRMLFAANDHFDADWRQDSYLKLFGQDQLELFGDRYRVLSAAFLVWLLFCAGAALYDRALRGRKPSRALRMACELYVVALLATLFLPENFRIGLYAGWVGLLVSRLTLVTAIFGLLALASLPLPTWSVRGFLALCAIYFVFLWQDTAKLDRLEANARAVAQTLPPRTRVVAVANPPLDWRIAFIYHSIDRACIGHCFSYANYEPSSTQFRVRVLPGSFFAADSSDQAELMSSGDYVVRKQDLPLTSIYQCDEADFTELCALPLREGKKTEDPETDEDPAASAGAEAKSGATSQPANSDRQP